MSVSNLDAIRNWAIRNQGAMPDLTLRLTFATDLARSVIEQDAAPDPQRVIEIGYDIGNLMWRIRSASHWITRQDPGSRGGPAAATRVILEAIRRGHLETGEIAAFVESHAGGTVDVVEITGRDEILDMPEFGYRPIAIQQSGSEYTFTDSGDMPCRSSKIRNLPSSISKARRSVVG